MAQLVVPPLEPPSLTVRQGLDTALSGVKPVRRLVLRRNAQPLEGSSVRTGNRLVWLAQVTRGSSVFIPDFLIFEV
jgi:hypothetical protein